MAAEKPKAVADPAETGAEAADAVRTANEAQAKTNADNTAERGTGGETSRNVGPIAPEDEKAGSYKVGQAAPETVFLCMGDDGLEQAVSTEQPERGHVLVFKGQIVGPEHVRAIRDAGGLS